MVGKMTKVVKFGGSSLASAGQFSKVGKIIKEDKARRFVVPSAPGKRNAKDTKVTDLLYQCYAQAEAEEDFKGTLKKIQSRFEAILNGLNMTFSLSGEFETIAENVAKKAGRDYAASRGEYLNGIVMAQYLGFSFIDAAEVIRFKDNGDFDAETTNELLSARLKGCEYAVIPGFYGARADGSIQTFSRGGSDITGSLVAKAVHADIYENWTDVSGFLIADPGIIKNPKVIKVITYRELRELSYMGATVLHEDAVFPVRREGIPINIRNTNAPEDEGTLIVESTCRQPDYTITGIAGKKNFTVIFLEKSLMNAEIGFAYRVLDVLFRHGISFEHMPSGIDTMSFVIDSEELSGGTLEEVEREIEEAVHPDKISVFSDVALIAVVGHGMSRTVGTAARLFSAIANTGVNVRMIDQGSSELNIIVGVDNMHYERTVRAVYEEFFKK